ncbi:hypothetical protein HY494_03190 [Candidatus Woesearchaeota archaeon]|nr:hypothetical protein [Candidatus Woesearchaeota archaeon]
MQKINRIYLRLANEEYDQVKLKTQNKGFAHVSEYLRSLAIEHEDFLHQKIIEIDRNLKKILELLEKG